MNTRPRENPPHSPLDLTSRTDVTLEHQVELDRLGEFVASIRVDNLVITDDIAELFALVVVDLRASSAGG